LVCQILNQGKIWQDSAVRFEQNLVGQPKFRRAYLGYGWHCTCHGRHFDEGAKLFEKNKKFYLRCLEPIFCVPYIHKLLSCINTASALA